MTPLAVTLLVAFSNVALHLNVRQQALCGQAAGALVHGACRKHRSGRQQARTGAQRLPEAHSLHTGSLSQAGLIACRILGLIIFVAAIVLDVHETIEDDHHWALFFTNWTFVGFGMCMAIGILRSCQVHWGRAGSQQPQHLERAASELQQQGQQAASPLMQLDAQQLKKAGAVQGAAVGRVRVLVFSGADAQPGSPAGTTRCGNCASCALSLWPQLDSFFLVAFQTVCAASVFLTIFYWVCVYQPETMAASSPLKHGMSAALMLLDVLLSRIPIMMRHAQVVTLYGTCYMLVMWANWALTSTWVYPVLDWTQPRSIIFYALLPTLLLTCYWLMWKVAHLREGMLEAGAAGARVPSTSAQAKELRRRVRMAASAWRRGRRRAALALSTGSLAKLLGVLVPVWLIAAAPASGVVAQ